MSSFTRPLIVEVLDLPIKEKPFIIAAPFEFISDVLKCTINIHVGYRTDFASIPQFFWRILPPIGRHGKAAVIHDWLCDPEDDGGNKIPHPCDYLTAAEVFNEAMIVLKVANWKRTVMVWAVKKFGPRFIAGDKTTDGCA